MIARLGLMPCRSPNPKQASRVMMMYADDSGGSNLALGDGQVHWAACGNVLSR